MREEIRSALNDWLRRFFGPARPCNVNGVCSHIALVVMGFGGLAILGSLLR